MKSVKFKHFTLLNKTYIKIKNFCLYQIKYLKLSLRKLGNIISQNLINKKFLNIKCYFENANILKIVLVNKSCNTLLIKYQNERLHLKTKNRTNMLFDTVLTLLSSRGKYF